jgi:hippurate hydrolase
VTVNNDAEAEFAAHTIAELHGEERFSWSDNPLQASEDFSHILNEIPGAMITLGACPPGSAPDIVPYNHSPHAVFDDAVLADVAALYAGLALRRLNAVA